MKKRTALEADRYFTYLAKNFPVMCASDEFHFFPRAENAVQYYDRMDNLAPENIEKLIGTIKDFRNAFSRLQSGEKDPEKLIDFELLKSSAAGILIDFEQKKSWQHNPLLYLKTAFIGLDHALTKPCDGQEEQVHRFLSRLNSIPGLLHQAMDNLKQIPSAYYNAAIAMAGDCGKYLEEISGTVSPEHFGGESRNLRAGLQKTVDALNRLQRFLQSFSPIPDRRFSASSIETTLNEHFLCKRSLDEIFDIGLEEWNENLKKLEELKSIVDAGKSWQDLYHAFFPGEIGKKNILSLYQEEAEKLRKFFSTSGFEKKHLLSPLEITRTPSYLLSVRGSASFAAALKADGREKSFFYITTGLAAPGTPEEKNLLVKRLNREYKFLTAHETIPGHHLLDTVRRSLENPVRRQIESPLFYEGWASYAESLLTENNYINNPLQMIVDFKRRLWRAARCQIDAGLPTGRLERQDAEKLLITAGFSQQEAERQIDRFQLNPGYQLCYCLGQYEIKQIKKDVAPKIGNKRFHNLMLEGGELPFHLIKKRWEK